MSLWTLTKQFRFEAAHKLPHHDGKCRNLHGHSFIGRILVAGTEVKEHGPKAGMLMDFKDMKSPLTVLLEDFLDHHYLNETTGLENPTSEELARWIFNKLKPNIPLLVAVQIDETCTSSCDYRP